jgi:hypothetical protein
VGLLYGGNVGLEIVPEGGRLVLRYFRVADPGVDGTWLLCFGSATPPGGWGRKPWPMAKATSTSTPP